MYRLGRILALHLLPIASLAAQADVGSAPQRSPYKDLEYRQEFTLFSGYYRGAKDPAGVAPQSGPMVGGRYEFRMGGPAYIVGRVAGAHLDRTVINPQSPTEAGRTSSERVPLLLTDVGLQLHLTGFKSWRGLVPIVAGGLGFTADLRGKTDVGQFRIGIPFTLTYGAGVKWVPGGRWQYRLDWSQYMFRLHYPETYYIKSGELPAVLTPDVPRDFWRRNGAITFGVSYANFR